MIAVIGAVSVSVDVRLKPPARDAELQKKQDEMRGKLDEIAKKNGL